MTTRALPSTAVRDALRTIADGLRNDTPHGEFTAGDRLTVARELANGDLALERDLLMRMPHITWATTRAEYSLILDRASFGA